MKFRFAFSTADVPHVENLREALFAWGLSRHLQGDFILTVTDGGTGWQPMLAALAWLGVDWDAGPDQTAEMGWGDEAATEEEAAATLTAVSPLLNSGLAAMTAEQTIRLTLPPLTLPNGTPLPQRGYRLTDLQDAGYLPQAIFNYLLLLGWQPPSERLIVDKWQVRREFAPDRLSTQTAVFDSSRLRQINRHYLQQLSSAALAEGIRPFLEDAYGLLPSSPSWLAQLAALIQPQLSTLEESIEAAEFALSDAVDVSGEEVTAVLQQPTTPHILTQLIAEVAHIVLLDAHTAQAILNGLQTRLAPHNITPTHIQHTIRAALSGQTTGPPLPQMMSLIGKQRTLQRAAHLLRP